MKNVWKIFMFIVVGVMLFSTTCVFAGDNKPSGAAGEIQAAGNEILSAILWFGYAIALGMVVYIGIKYIMGAADAKANMKSAIVAWLIGAFIIVACTTIVGWVTGVIGVNTAGQIIEAGRNLLKK